MSLDLYYVPASAPCRAVMLAANAVGVQLNLKRVDLMKGEHLTPEFIKVRNFRRTHSLR
jgi:glutathione S-transferase